MEIPAPHDLVMRDLLAFQADLRQEPRSRVLAPIEDLLTIVDGEVELTVVIDAVVHEGPSGTPW
jgi:hypothetical protein